jgi:hypothetical protein
LNGNCCLEFIGCVADCQRCHPVAAAFCSAVAVVTSHMDAMDAIESTDY